MTKKQTKKNLYSVSKLRLSITAVSISKTTDFAPFNRIFINFPKAFSER